MFSPRDDDLLFSAAANRVTYVDLHRSTANAVGNFEARKDVDCVALTSDGVLLVAIDVDGRLTAINARARRQLQNPLPPPPPPLV